MPPERLAYGIGLNKTTIRRGAKIHRRTSNIMGKKMLGKKMAAIFLPIHFSAPNVLAPKTSY